MCHSLPLGSPRLASRLFEPEGRQGDVQQRRESLTLYVPLVREESLFHYPSVDVLTDLLTSLGHALILKQVTARSNELP